MKGGGTTMNRLEARKGRGYINLMDLPSSEQDVGIVWKHLWVIGEDIELGNI